MKNYLKMSNLILQYKVLINKDYEKYNLSENDICIIPITIIKKIDYSTWLKILNK